MHSVAEEKSLWPHLLGSADTGIQARWYRQTERQRPEQEQELQQVLNEG